MKSIKRKRSSTPRREQAPVFCSKCQSQAAAGRGRCGYCHLDFAPFIEHANTTHTAKVA